MNVEWAGPDEPNFLPDHIPDNSGRKFYQFALALREHPGVWAKYPGNYTRTKANARAIVNHIRSGRRTTLPPPEFEARADQDGTVWVRYIS